MNENDELVNEQSSSLYESYESIRQEQDRIMREMTLAYARMTAGEAAYRALHGEAMKAHIGSDLLARLGLPNPAEKTASRRSRPKRKKAAKAAQPADRNDSMEAHQGDGD